MASCTSTPAGVRCLLLLAALAALVAPTTVSARALSLDGALTVQAAADTQQQATLAAQDAAAAVVAAAAAATANKVASVVMLPAADSSGAAAAAGMQTAQVGAATVAPVVTAATATGAQDTAAAAADATAATTGVLAGGAAAAAAQTAGAVEQPQQLEQAQAVPQAAGTAATAASVAAAGAGMSSGPATLDDLYLCQDKLKDSTILEQLPQLKIAQVLDSSKPRSAQDVTLVTQLSFERLYMLEGQCDVWNGVISAAVYVALLNGRVVTVELNSNQDPRLTDLAEVEAKFRQFHQLAEAKGLCKLDLMLVSQDVESIWLSALYPVNAMRNRALANARTDAVLLLDVDFWPSAELSELMQKPAKYDSLMAALNAGTAVVLPAYETGDAGDIGVEVAREAVLEGKDAAVKMFWDGRVKAFHTDRYEAGHRPTDYKRWLEASRPYPIRYEEGYEPYVIVSRKYVPWYDERFVGYRKNKVVHLLYLSTSGIQFVVHPRAFTVHAPHPRARTWKVTHKTGLWDQLADLYEKTKEGMLTGTYIPAAMYSCGEHAVGPMLSRKPTFASPAAVAVA